MRNLGDELVSRSKHGSVETLSEGVAQFHGFGNVGFVWGNGECLVVDTSNARTGPRAAAALRETTPEPVAAIVYTHGHVDHVGGAPAFLDSARTAGHERPVIWGHENIAARFARYTATWDWNNEMNRRQFGLPKGTDAFPREFIYPDRTYRTETRFDLAGEPVELHHASAETEDATWVWLPERQVALVGDLSVNSLPNTGNPNKGQRYTLGWAEALERIAERQPQIVVPGHGHPLRGEQALEVLTETARALRLLHDAVLERLNRGLWPDEVVDQGIRLPDDLAKKPYLQPIYGCSQFVVRDLLRAYAGWWGGDPAQLIPARRSEVAQDIVEAASREALLSKTRKLQSEGELRRALHLASILAQAEPADAEAHALVAEICDGLVATEPSFITRNFYRAAATQAREAPES
jgi:alkyl sulfatase BDS1-like metallo-beta-lactamase superfamily hydrolase